MRFRSYDMVASDSCLPLCHTTGGCHRSDVFLGGQDHMGCEDVLEDNPASVADPTW